MKKSKISHKLAAVATMGYLAATATEAHAQNATDFQDLSNNIITSTGNLTGLISTVAYIGGAGLGVAGIFKLKQHVDNPGQVALKDGLVRLGAGGGLLALPFVQSAMSGSIGDGSGNAVDATTLQLDSSDTFVR